MNLEDCLGLVAHQPAVDVAYQPDVDAAGNALVPVTQTDAGTITPPSTIAVDIDVDMARGFGLPTDLKLYQGEARSAC